MNIKKYCTDILIDQTFDQKHTLIFYVPKLRHDDGLHKLWFLAFFAQI